MKTEWSNKDSLEIPEITAGYGSVSWSDYKMGTSCDSVGLRVGLPTVNVIPIEWIENYVEEHWRTTKLYATNYVWQMLEDWEKENG